MPIRNWGGGGDHSSTFLALQDEFIRRAQELIERQKAEREARAARRSSGGGGGRSGSSSSSVDYEQAGVILDGISKGTTNWRNLYAFYKKELTRVKTPALKRQVMRQIQNIELVAEANGISLAGGVAPATADAAAPGTNRYTPKSILTPEVDAAINDQILYLMATRNGVYPGNDRPLQSYMGRMLYDGSVKELREGMIADAKLQEEIMSDIKEGATQVLDPVSGIYMEVTPDFTLNLIYQYNENQLALAGLERGLGAEGDFASRIATWESVQDTLIAPIITTQVFPLVNEEGTAAEPNVDGIRGYMDQKMVHFNVLKNMALQSSDPADVIKNLTAAGRSLDSSMRDIQGFINSLPEGFEVEEYLLKDIEYSIQLADFMKNTGGMTAEEAMTIGSQILEAHPGDNYFLSRSDVTQLIGGWTDEVGTIGEKGSAVEGRVSPGWHGVGGALAALDGISANIAGRQQGPEFVADVEPYVYVAPFGQSAPVAVPQSQAAQYLRALSSNQLFDEGLSGGAVPSVEMVRLPNGRMTSTVVWREMKPPAMEDITWWSKVDERTGQTIWATQADFEQFGGDKLLAYQQGWEQAPFAGLENIYQVLGADGQTYYVRGDTKQIYVNQPLNLPVGAEFHFTDLLDENGAILPDYRFATYNGDFVLTGPGVNYKVAQRVMNNALLSGEIDISDYKILNDQGVPLNAPSIDDIIADMVPPPQYWASTYHEDIRRQYAENQKQYYMKARREQSKAQDVRRKWLASHTEDPRLTKRGDFEGQYENVIENSIEVAARQIGVRFGSTGSKRPQGFRQPEYEPDPIQLARPVLPPISYDAVKPPTVAPMPGTTPPPPPPKKDPAPAPVAQPKPKGSGSGGGTRVI